MATTVNNAFAEFMKDTVNIDSTQTKTACASRDNLLANIKSFSGDSDFFSINGSRCLRFGSFERHTKLRPLDDIDLMICISGTDDRKYSYAGNGIYYMGANDTDIKNGLNTVYFKGNQAEQYRIFVQKYASAVGKHIEVKICY